MDTTALSENGEAPAQQRWLRPELVASWGEIIAVLLVIIGISTGVSSWMAWRGSSRHFVSDLLNDQQMIHTLTMEAPILGLLFVHLYRRGWRMADFRIRPDWSSTGMGLLLLPAMAVANSVVVIAGLLIFFTLQTRYPHSGCASA